MKKLTLIPFVLAVVLFLIFLFFPNRVLEQWVSDKQVETAKTEMNPLVFQGSYMQSRMLSEENIMPVFGSSELVRYDPFHPYNYTKAADTPYSTYLVGRGGTQSITHFLNIAEQDKNLAGKKVIFLISPQWFTSEGMDEHHFSPNYSMLQAYDLAFNESLDQSIKIRGMKRLLDFDAVKRDPVLRTMYEYQISKKQKHKVMGVVATEIGSLTRQLQHKKDLYYSLFIGKDEADLKANPSLVTGKTFEEQVAASEKYGAARVKNEYGIDEKYYKKKIKPKLKKLKNSRSGESYLTSPEYADLQLVMDAFESAGAEALFVSMPLNAKWYDYAGFGKEKRDAYYQKMDDFLVESGQSYVDFSAHENDPYFLTDTLHMGWKGWVYLDRSMDEFWAAE